MNTEDTTKYIQGKLLQEHRRGLDASYRTEIFTEHGVRVAAVDLCPENVPNGQVYLRGGTARRLVACWNALEGVPTEEIEKRGDFFSSAYRINVAFKNAKAAIEKDGGEW